MARYSTKIKPKQSTKKIAFPLWLALIGLVLVALAAFGLWSSNRPSKVDAQIIGAAGIKVDQDVIDHGDVKLSTQIRDVVKVTNIGDKPLRFTQEPYIEVKEGC